jgi:hypothetical protein
MSRRFVMTLIGVTVAGTLVATASIQSHALFPYTKQLRPATAEYSHEGLKVVVNYNYSQTNHETPWLIIYLAASSRRSFVLRPEHVRLVSFDGSIVALPKRGTVLADWMNTRSEMAVAVRDDLRSYFTGESEEPLPFFMTRQLKLLPYDEAIVDDNHMTQGPLYFRSPEGRWAAGTYRLTIDNEHAKAALPVTLR